MKARNKTRSDSGRRSPFGRARRPDDSGMVLVVGILFIVILAAIGSIAYMTTSNDLLISGNYKTYNQAFNAAQAGLEEARVRTRLPKTDANFTGDTSSPEDDWWSAYILTDQGWSSSDDPEYDSNLRNYIPTSVSKTSTSVSANSLQSDMDYFVRIRHKREYDAEQAGHTTANPHYVDNDGSTSTHTASSPGNIIYYGYGDPAHDTTLVQYTTAAGSEYPPVEIITAHGVSAGSNYTLEIEGARYPGPPIVAAIYAKADITGNGSALVVDANDNCGAGPAKPPLYTLSPHITNLNGTPVLAGNPAVPVSGTDNIDIANYVATLRDQADIILTADQSGGTIGSSTDYMVAYSDTSNPYNVSGLKLQNITGYGILLVQGDLTLGGGFTWYGLMLVTGTLVFNGGGAGINIIGAVMAEQTVDLNGGIYVNYDSCQVQEALSSSSMTALTWRDKSLMQ